MRRTVIGTGRESAVSNTSGYRSRAYELWTDERNIELVVRIGLCEEQIAERIGRSLPRCGRSAAR